jgi:hypothetical protein
MQPLNEHAPSFKQHGTGQNSMNLNNIFFGMALLAGTALPAHAGNVGVGVVIDINQPGVYGRVELGNRPPPPVYYPQPVIIVPPPVYVTQQPTYVAPAPVYMKVPPGHQKKWAKHCYRYNACNQPVYFVQYEERRGKGHKNHGHRD